MGSFSKAVHVWNRVQDGEPRDAGASLNDFAMYCVSLKNVFYSSVPFVSRLVNNSCDS